MIEDPAPPPSGPYDGRVDFRNQSGEASAPLEMIVPIGLYDPLAGLFQPYATGVFISSIGLICTARHVFEFERQFIESMEHLSAHSFPAIYQLFDDHSASVRRIAAAHLHDSFDLAVAMAEPVHHRSSGAAFDNKVMALTTDTMPIGTVVHQYSYPDPFIFNHATAEGPQLVIIPLHTKGVIIDWFPEGMGALFPSPCYVIEGYIGPGSSGGPVMDETGRVFAVSSRGNDADNYYYAVPVREIAPIRVESVQLATPPAIRGPTVRQMAARGVMSFVKPVDAD